MKAIFSLPDHNSAMRSYLKQAKIKDSMKQSLKKTVRAPWVAKVENDGKLTFLKGQTDYACSDTLGTKGVIYRFILDSGNQYKACTYERGRAIITNYKVTDEGEIIKI